MIRRQPLLVCGLTLCVAGLSSTASAHLDAEATVPTFLTPVGIQETNVPVALSWIDGDTDSSGVFTFTARQGNGPPLHHLLEEFSQGEVLFEVTVLDTANALTWDVQDVATGAWNVVSETTDPSLCAATVFAPALVVVQQPGDPVPLGGHFAKPFSMSTVADTAGSITLGAVGDGPPTVTIWAGLMEAVSDVDPTTLETEEEKCPHMIQDFIPTHPVVEDAVMEVDEDGGAGRWRLLHTWDTSGVSEDTYLLRASLSDELGRTSTVYSGGWFTVYHPETPLGPPPEEDASLGGDVDEGDVEGPSGPPPTPDVLDTSLGPGGDGDSAPATERPASSGCSSDLGSTPAGVLGVLFGWLVLVGPGRRMGSRSGSGF